jgi:hypothetical protein
LDLAFSAFSSAGFSTLMLRLVLHYDREAAEEKADFFIILDPPG